MASWKKVVVSGSDANLKSLVVSQSVNATSFTGSLQGNALSAEVVVINSDTAPTSSLSGSLWYNTDNLTLYVRYTDPSGSTYWVPSYNDGIPLTASYSETSSYVNTAQTASYWSGSIVSSSYAESSSYANVLTSTASQAYTASYVVTAQTASYWSGTTVSASYASSSTNSKTALTASIATSRRSTGMVWNAFLSNPSSYGGSLLGNAVFDNNDAGVKLTTTSIGQTGNILWNLTGSNAFDFTQDFRGTFATYYGATAGNLSSGDGFVFNFGGTQTTLQTQGPTDNSLSVRIETYQDSSGSYLYTNGTQVGFNKAFTMGVANISNAWNTWIVEVRTVPLLGKKFATLYWGSSLWPQVTADITSWTPGGKTFVVSAWTGGAVANQWCKSAVLEYI